MRELLYFLLAILVGALIGLGLAMLTVRWSGGGALKLYEYYLGGVR